ncbi:MAG: GH3 auxin-responsive promoter family protein [Chloroflexi bacterium]|nr:GH3 auxin-responsive promoter family protein [Chloroflexota bacterium]
MAVQQELPIERAAWNPATAWRRFCGFLDITRETFMEIQSQLMLEQIDLIAESRIGRRLIRNGKPASVQEYRAKVPLTSYGDYVKLLAPGQEQNLPPRDYIWSHTSGALAGYKWVPYTTRGFTRFLDNLMSAMVLACATGPEDLNIAPGDVVMFNAPPRPYLSGLAVFGMAKRFGLLGVSDPATVENMDFKEKVRHDFREALRKRVDVIISMTSVLVRTGQQFEEDGGQRNGKSTSAHLSLNARALGRIAIAKGKSVALHRPVRPRDLWPARAVIGWGADTPIFRDQVKEYWGKYPYEMYACTEGGVMGMQTWERRGMVFNPYADFYEFIPEEESRKAREDDRYDPQTVLLPEVKPGEIYEVVISNFYGMPLLRYRVGHFVRFLNTPRGAERPEFEWLGRSDDRIDIAGFTRVDEKTVWQALRDSNLEFSDWTLKREMSDEIPLLHFYGETRRDYDPAEAARKLHEQIKQIDSFYRDLETMLEIRPLRMTLLAPGTFDRYYDEKMKQGEDIGRARPPRMNAFDDAIVELLTYSRQISESDLAARPETREREKVLAR